MKDFNFSNYTGRNVRIAILDSGIINDIPCINYDGTLIDTANISASQNNHAKYCLAASKISAPNSEYFLVNIGDPVSNDIIEKLAISGLEIAISMMPKIIIMSFSFENISKKFKDLIVKATDSGIIVCASVDPILKNSYPQKLDNVISVEESKGEMNEKIVFDKGVFYISTLEYSKVSGLGSSFANAYFAGVLGAIAEFSPLITCDSIKQFYQSTMKSEELQNKANAFYLIPGLHMTNDLTPLLTSNYQYYFDNNKNIFRDIKNEKEVEDSIINEIDIICGDDFMVKNPSEIDEFIRRKIPFTCYNNFAEDLNYLKEDFTSLKTISVPSICICSYGMNMEKLHIQLEINKYFKTKNYNVGNISFNPISYLVGYEYVPYPHTISYPQYVYSLNNKLYEASLNKDLIISAIPGDFDRFISFEHRLGDLSNLFFMSHNPDIVIVCISQFIQISELKKVKLFVENSIGAKIVFYISKHNRDDNYYGPSDYNIVLSDTDVDYHCKQVIHATKVKSFIHSNILDKSLPEFLLKLLAG